jgi:phenylacetate-CoA ligase
LELLVELAPGIEPSGERQQAIAASIRHHLCRLNSEFANYVPEHYQMPQISLLQTGDPEYFPMGVKHRYTRSSVSNSV